MSLTESCIQKRLYYNLMMQKSRAMAMPNIYAYGENESDFLTITNNGYVDEYEIKISRADFKADARKLRHEAYQHLSPWTGYRWYMDGLEMTRVELVGLAYKFPNRFWYVVPSGMITADDIPEHAGLMYISEEGRLRQVQPAPRLHREKVHHRVKQKMYTAAMYRYHNFWTQNSLQN